MALSNTATPIYYSRFWDGKVYWCKIYDRLLTEEQIDAILAE